MGRISRVKRENWQTRWLSVPLRRGRGASPQTQQNAAGALRRRFLNKRNRLYYHRNKCNNEEDEDAITKDIIIVTDMLKKVKKEIKLCDVIYNNVTEMKQQIKEVEDRKQEKEIKQKKKIKNYEL